MRVARMRCVVLFGVTWCALVAMRGSSNAQASGPNPVVAAADSTYAPRYRFTPVFTNKIDSNVSSVGMSNDFHTGLLTPWGSIFDFSISADEKNYRLQNRNEENKVMRLSDLHTFSPFWNGSTSYSDSRVFNRAIAVGGGIQDFIINDQQVNLGSTYHRIYRNLRADMIGSGGAITSERAFKNDRGLQGGANGGVAVDIGRRITVQGRGAWRQSWDQSETVDSLFAGLGSQEDSVSTAIAIQATDSIRFDLSHKRYSGDRNFADQGRGSLGSQTGGAENVFQETEMRDTRNTTLTMASRVLTRLDVGLTASHDEQVFDYAVQTTRFSSTVSNSVSGNIRYKLPWRTTTTLQFENGETNHDLGEESVSSFKDKRKRVALTANHQFSKTFSMDLSGSTQLTQSFFYRNLIDPRDRDQRDTNLDLRFSSQPYKKIAATISVSYSVADFINIDDSQSQNNRTRELWELRPAFTYVMNSMLTIVQSYGLTFEYTDYDFQADQNFLDRNIQFSNEFQFHPTKSIDFRFEYALYEHDSGSYLPNPATGVRELDVASEDRRDRTRLRLDYKFTKHIGFFAENQYSHREDTDPDTGDVIRGTTDGQIQVGTSTNYDWGSGRSLRLLVSRVKRFSPFGSEEEKNYWDARSEFAYPF